MKSMKIFFYLILSIIFVKIIVQENNDLKKIKDLKKTSTSLVWLFWELANRQSAQGNGKRL